MNYSKLFLAVDLLPCNIQAIPTKNPFRVVVTFLREKKNIICIFMLLILPFSGFTQNIQVKGRVMEEFNDSEEPVGFANISLMKSDSTFVTGTSTDNNGNFDIRNIRQGDYLLSISYIGYEQRYLELTNLSKSIDLGNIRIIQSSINLGEVTISASSYVNQIDRKIIFPDEKQIAKSTDGMDLLRNLQLSGIDINRLDKTISGARGGKADVRINGKQVQQQEVLGINPKDIIRIEYHDNPSLRHGDSEVVIDYILRRRETGGSVMVYAQKGLPADRTDAFSVAKMNYRKSEFSLLGGYGHYDYDESYRTNREEFNFLDGNSIIRKEEGLPERRKNDVASFELGYSFLEPDKHHFALNTGLNLYDQINNSKSLLFQEDNKSNEVLMTERNTFEGIQPYAILYYQLKLKNKQQFVLDIAGNYYEPKIRRHYIEERHENTITNISNNIDGERFWATGEVFYEKTFDGGRLNIGVKYAQTNQKINYWGDFSSDISINQSNTYFYAEWMGNIKKFSYAAGVGGTQVHIEQGNEKSNSIHFTPTIRLGYQFSDQFRIQYTGRVGIKSPSDGDMSIVEQAIDTLQLRRGNPDLKPAQYYNNLLTISYEKKLFSTNLQILNNYTKNPLMESIFEENGKFIHLTENHKGLHQITTTGYVRVTSPDRSLSANLRGGLNWVRSRGDKYDHTLHNWFINAGIDYTWKKWNPFWNIGTRKNNLSGETINYSGQSTSFGIRYKLKKLSTSAYFIHSIGWDTGRDNLNKYASDNIRNYSPDSKNMFMIDLLWNIQFGRKYDNQQKKINNSDSDAGIMNINR